MANPFRRTEQPEPKDLHELYEHTRCWMRRALMGFLFLCLAVLVAFGLQKYNYDQQQAQRNRDVHNARVATCLQDNFKARGQIHAEESEIRALVRLAAAGSTRPPPNPVFLKTFYEGYDANVVKAHALTVARGGTKNVLDGPRDCTDAGIARYLAVRA